MATKKGRYPASLLRIWQVKDAGRGVWHASLEDPHTGERHGFASLEALIDFLREQSRNDKREGGIDQENNGGE